MIKYLQNSFIGNGFLKKAVLAIFIAVGFVFLCCGEISNIENAPKVLPTGEIEYDFMKQSQPKASKILYEYVLKDLDKPPKEAEKLFDVTKDRVKAFEIDLNADGKKEVIGYVSSTAYWCAFGYHLFILEKQSNSYINIVNELYAMDIEPILKIMILPNKTKDYKDIKFYCSVACNFKPIIAVYDGQTYIDKQFLNDLSK